MDSSPSTARSDSSKLTAGVSRVDGREVRSALSRTDEVDRNARAAMKAQTPMVMWFTGMSGAGKSTLSKLVESGLHAMGYHTVLLDGDDLRRGLNRDLGFAASDRVENVRRVAEVARLMADAGLVVLVALISPFRAERAFARSLLQPGEFMEIFVDADLAVLELRDTKGLYAKARRGEVQNFTGISSPYEAPEHPELRIDSQSVSATEAAERVIEVLLASGWPRPGL